MKTFRLLIYLLTICSILLIPAPVRAQHSPNPDEPFDGQPLCLPGAFPAGSQDCLALGPSEYLTALAQKGIVYPFRPLPASRPDDSLANAPVYYAKVNIAETESAALYGSLEDAVNSNNPIQRISPGRLIWVSYTQQVDQNGGHFLQLRSGAWMRASPAGYSRFMGLEFHKNPANSFGWIMETSKPRSAPSFQAPELEKTYIREAVIQIYDVLEAEGTTWYMIGLNEWLDRRYVRQFQVNPSPPQGVDNNRWIEVNLFEQTLGVYENGRLLFAALIATGVEPYYTQPGLFKVYKKKELELMSGAFEADRSDFYYLEDVPWTMYFDKQRALHGAYWRTLFGTPQSHGCVNLSIGDSHWLFNWAQEGDWVYVWDPSGATPTDPALYAGGGAP